ncbi:related to cell surface protein homologous to bacterial outer membrane proteins [Fusarium mangiferae]|uniref:Related to cell surface protein homologous to bacterial outer membrane proteins n=1 Tax=Fusarium mangiferae TaxID=192010 RepID=A0A1L7SXF9_FUSMA|nr:related to cell surface protein homologous to bacterial outer membrane proteins [Fusarium mangiferae]CVK91190.1 related to cell surface protein homologous to bacterial outer membrane proteins [Fusarium mangiferae]
MAAIPGSTGGPSMDPFNKLHSDTGSLLHEAESKPEFQKEQDEAKQRRLAQVIGDQQLAPMTINELRIHGAVNTRTNFLDPIFQPLIADASNASSTVGNVINSLRTASNKLDGLQIFQPQPEVYLTSAQQTDPSTSPTDVNVDIRVKELSRFKLQTGTDVGNGEGSAYGSLLWRNMFGGAEMLTLNAKAGTRTRSAYSATLTAPVKSNPDMRLSLEGVASAAEKPWASHEEVLKGGTLRFSWLNQQRDTQSVEYSGIWRQITGLAENASPTVRADAGDSIKSSVKHTFYRERRDNPQLPQSGYMFRSGLEVAGLGPLAGDVAFSKGEVEIGGAVPIPLPGIRERTGISIGGGLRLGLLCPLPLGYEFAGKLRPTRINDRFQLGGPTDVRGFKLGGLGPHDGSDSVGGDVFAAGSVNMLLPVPYKGPDSGLRFQLFANGGRLVALKDSKKSSSSGSTQELSGTAVRNGMVNAVGELLNGVPSVAAGVGLVYAHPVARFELNFSLPLALRKGEASTKGLQVGVGINFL